MYYVSNVTTEIPHPISLSRYKKIITHKLPKFLAKNNLNIRCVLISLPTSTLIKIQN